MEYCVNQKWQDGIFDLRDHDILISEETANRMFALRCNIPTGILLKSKMAGRHF